MYSIGNLPSLVICLFLIGLQWNIELTTGETWTDRLIDNINFWRIRNPRTPPKILFDKRWGNHSFIQLKDVKLHYVQNGDKSKPLMIFVHGFPEFWFSWRFQLEYFAKTHWVVAFDMRGFGESEKPPESTNNVLALVESDIVELVAALGKKECILVAHDVGGWFAYHVAANHPEIVQKLVIMNVPHPTSFRKDLERPFSLDRVLYSWYLLILAVPGLADTFGAFSRRLFFNGYFSNNSPEEIQAYEYMYSTIDSWHSVLNYDRIELPKYIPDSRFRANKSPIEDIPIIQTPTLLIWGVFDALFPRKYAELTRPYVKDLRVEYLYGFHGIQMNKPNEVNKLIEQFIQ